MSAHLKHYTCNMTDSEEVPGNDIGSDVSLIFNRMKKPGLGPGLHCHPYSETFLVLSGSVEFRGLQGSFVAQPRTVVVVPAHTPHRFTSLSDNLEMIDVHANRHFITRWL
ncbi:cupin domain-containing protein [Roseibium sp. M-1]